MDGESSYESDISESWSLIDVNTKDESLHVTEAPCELEKTPATKLEKTPVTKLENVEPGERSDLQLKDCEQKCTEIHKTDFGLSCNSNSNCCFVNEGFGSSAYKEEKAEGIHSPCQKSVQDDEQSDSDDIESIEVLDLDGNYRESEIDRPDSISDSHDSQTYQSDDEESLEGNASNQSRNNSSTVIKRKRKNLCSNPEGVVNSVNSEDRSLGECGVKACPNEAEKNSDKSEEDSCKGSGHPACKHYRNNVANTVLTLSVGVLFAGVACIAICHFLGVQDGPETAGELAETLKKLQMENAALQSRLYHLNRALLSRESSSKSILASDRVLCKEGQKVETSKAPENDLSRAALSEISSSLNSIEWLSKLQNLIRNDNKETGNGNDFNGFGKYIHDQLNILRTGKEEGVKLLEGADRKIFKVLQKIVTKLSMSHDNIESLYRRLINLKNKLNHKLNQILPEAPEEIAVVNSKFPRKVPVTELDLQSVQWDSDEKVANNYPKDYPKSVIVYQFPQPEKYYQVEVRNLESTDEKPLGETNSNETLQKGEETGKKDNTINKCESERRKHKKRGRVNRKKEGSKEKELEDGSKEKGQKRSVKKFLAKQSEKEKRKKATRVFGSETAKAVLRPSVIESGFQHSKAEAEVIKPKKLKKRKKCKVKKCSLTKLRKDFYEEVEEKKKKKQHNQVCSVQECFNSTGYWMFKWADGRDEFRRHQMLGDWQFTRAKGRKELRDDDRSVNWQFRRAVGRESNRHGGCWHPGKGTKFNGKGFFHDRFSWI